ncbi:hypothetical protein PAECIP111891_07026 [Paenibacillus allorhizoplanae]|uniref:Uncharacterized protein n=1 Tax=Paenibacillus allorhizoplanae TaxID=2905648 RepID=A0ABM9CZE1_9BACL|nr:hypothetical protein [Paenibacillus allorhizoplanae]CAH1232505.1 hypothetical protein PAECIP111891_07026 [Paenibacillus allorhizoplanae]
MKSRMIRVVSVVLVATATATAIALTSAQLTNEKVTKAENDQVAAFQREVHPVVEGVVEKYFLKENQSSETMTDADRLKYMEQLDWYWDNDNLQVVFVVLKEDAEEMKAIRKELEEKLGAKVKFVKSRISQTTLEMSEMSNEVSKFIFNTIKPNDMYYEGGYFRDKQRIEIKGAFTDEQVQAIYAKFDKKLVNITKIAPRGDGGPTAF